MELTPGQIRREQVGRARFKSGIEYQKQELNLARVIQNRLLSNLPSNYPKDTNTNLAGFYRAISEEFARLQISASNINEDHYHTQTRTEYLFQILGDSLFLGENTINEQLTDEQYRAFLLRVRDAYYGGSRKENIEGAVSDIIGLPVILKEVYLFLRQNKTSYKIIDTHKMFFDIFMDSYGSTSSIGVILQNLRFFIDIIKPAHVVYDTRLIWTDNFTNRGGKCKPVYLTSPMSEVVYNSEKLYLITHLLSSLYITEVETGDEGWTSGTIDSIDTTNKIIKTTDYKILTYDLNTKFYRRNVDGEDSLISVDILNVGEEIRYFSTKDSSSSSNVINSTWLYSGDILDINETLEIITLSNSSKVVFNQDTLVYTRDGNGEYRIDLDDLLVGFEIAFKGEKFTGTFNFYNVPDEVANNPYKQFDNKVISKPYFQGNVKKYKDIQNGLTGGPQILIQDGIATVSDVDSKFYKRENSKDKKEKTIYRYSLYIDDSYVTQFSVKEPNDPLTESQAFRRFVDFYGMTGLEAPGINYNIERTITGQIEESSEEPIIETIGDKTEFCDRKTMCPLYYEYEDTREYFPWPGLKLTSGFIVSVENFGNVSNPPGEWDIPGAYTISEDLNDYEMPLLPVMDINGNIASKDDLVVYVNGVSIENAISTLDPWSGVVTLNFIPPYNTVIRVDYYYAKRYPDSKIYFEKIDNDILALAGITGVGNLGAQYTILETGSQTSRLTWPFEVTPEYYGTSRDYQVNEFPILNREGELIDKDELVTYIGNEVDTAEVSVTVNLDTTVITKLSGDWVGVAVGDTLKIDVKNYLDNTIINEVNEVSGKEITLNRSIPIDTALTYQVAVIKYLWVPNAVESVKPLLGHIKLNFLPPSGYYVRFDYYFSNYDRRYGFIPDDINGYLSDTIVNARSNYALLVDSGITGLNQPITDNLQVQKIGYRYRAFDLANSSVLNSSDTLKTNEYDRYKKRASLKSKGHVLNENSLIFSPEYIEDRDPYIVLDDKYLKKNIPANTILNRGTPIFPKTFTDDGHYRLSDAPVGEDTYTIGLTGIVDLKGSFEIIGEDKSGDIDYYPVCNYEKTERINLYSDLKVESFPYSGSNLPLSTISEGTRTLPVSTVMVEQYYPNREVRVNDYLDYINKVPDEIKAGTFKALNNSDIVKSISINFLALRKGDVFTLNYNGKDYKYTVIDIFDNETLKINQLFDLPSGEYRFSLVRDVLLNVDVLFFGGDRDGKYGPLNRLLVLNNDIGHTYGLPTSILQHFPGYGVKGVNYSLEFVDPDSDPYPRNPDNPDLNFPAGSELLSSEIITAEGTSVYYPFTGTYAGLTGPSGALDLGITGPTSVVNPFIYTGDKNPTYNVPSGDTGIYSSYSESEYRVHWRNWDQEMIFINIGSATGANAGIIEEDPLNLMDDLGEGIVDYYWKPSTSEVIRYYFYGSVVKASDDINTTVARVDYPLGLIPITRDQALEIETGTDPATLGLMEDNYSLYRLIIWEILQDNSLKTTEIQELNVEHED